MKCHRWLFQRQMPVTRSEMSDMTVGDMPWEPLPDQFEALLITKTVKIDKGQFYLPEVKYLSMTNIRVVKVLHCCWRSSIMLVYDIYELCKWWYNGSWAQGTGLVLLILGKVTIWIQRSIVTQWICLVLYWVTGMTEQFQLEGWTIHFQDPSHCLWLLDKDFYENHLDSNPSESLYRFNILY